ncbi:MGMT family protein [Streptomyces sp. NPDC058545]|uniref:MGMT family protein n=1 Tax=Streptomyces sp. NPDC058545 TaxID=3346544 RepID=UPI00364B0B47
MRRKQDREPAPASHPEHADDEWAGWRELREILLAVPAGTWTSYGDLAALIGTSAIAVGNHVSAKTGLHCAYRVLTADGRIAGGFRWTDDRHSGDPRLVLEAEGVPFDANGRAVKSHRLSASDLAVLVGKEVPEESLPGAAPQSGDETTEGTVARFEALLRDNQPPEVVESVLTVLRFWEEQGGHLIYGKGSETSCFPTVDTGGPNASRALWPIAIYPVSGTVEVVFQYLKRRPPFDDEPLRRALMEQFNSVDGIDLAEAKLDLRPSFPLEVFAGQGEDIRAVLEWFVHEVALAEARRPFDEDSAQAVF